MLEDLGVPLEIDLGHGGEMRILLPSLAHLAAREERIGGHVLEGGEPPAVGALDVLGEALGINHELDELLAEVRVLVGGVLG